VNQQSGSRAEPAGLYGSWCLWSCLYGGFYTRVRGVIRPRFLGSDTSYVFDRSKALRGSWIPGNSRFRLAAFCQPKINSSPTLLQNRGAMGVPTKDRFRKGFNFQRVHVNADRQMTWEQWWIDEAGNPQDSNEKEGT
jgi:hypothetical protein